jgi:hypothetical protein
MAEEKIFIEAADCLFLEAVEWSMVEQTLSKDVRDTIAQQGYPTIELADGRYAYIPIIVNNIDFKCVQGRRPEAISDA